MNVESVSAPSPREPVLSPVDRISELLFGLFMALTFVGAVSVTEAGQDDIRAMLAAALAATCMGTRRCGHVPGPHSDRSRPRDHADPLGALGPGCRNGAQDHRGFLVEDSCEPLSAAEIEAMRGRVLALPSVPERPKLEANDLLAALAVFLLVVASTFPVVLPFVFIQDVAVAKSLLAVSRS